MFKLFWSQPSESAQFRGDFLQLVVKTIAG